MRKTILVVLVMALAVGFIYAIAIAHGGMMGEPGEQTQQWGWGPGMMGGYGMGPGMMGGYGMGPGMMGGYGYGPGMMNIYNPQMRKFLDETTDLRRQLHMKQFEYMEALRDPKTKPEAMQKLQKEIRDLNIKLYEKMPFYQYGQ